MTKKVNVPVPHISDDMFKNWLFSVVQTEGKRVLSQTFADRLFDRVEQKFDALAARRLRSAAFKNAAIDAAVDEAMSKYRQAMHADNYEIEHLRDKISDLQDLVVSLQASVAELQRKPVGRRKG